MTEPEIGTLTMESYFQLQEKWDEHQIGVIVIGYCRTKAAVCGIDSLLREIYTTATSRGLEAEIQSF